MHYLALLFSTEPPVAADPEAQAAGMAEFEAFHAKAASAIRSGDALTPSATGVRITGGPDTPVVTDGPFAESAEVACGYYVFEAENLDEALGLARDIPVAKFGAVEIWPMVQYFPPSRPARHLLAGAAARAPFRYPRAGHAGMGPGHRRPSEVRSRGR